jgi:hypothetical protein
MSTMQELVKAVKDHATKNYETDGWDVVVEAFEDSEIADEIRKAGARTSEDAIKVLGEIVKLHDEQRKDVQAEIF